MAETRDEALPLANSAKSKVSPRNAHLSINPSSKSIQKGHFIVSSSYVYVNLDFLYKQKISGIPEQ